MHPNAAEGMANSVDPDQTALWEQYDLGLHLPLRYANNFGSDIPAHLHSLVRAFSVCLLMVQGYI